MENTKETIDAYIVYFKKNGKKLPFLTNSKRRADKFKANLLENKRKYLGRRSVKVKVLETN
jgi:hypothetical protein